MRKRFSAFFSQLEQSAESRAADNLIVSKVFGAISIGAVAVLNIVDATNGNSSEVRIFNNTFAGSCLAASTISYIWARHQMRSEVPSTEEVDIFPATLFNDHILNGLAEVYEVESPFVLHAVQAPVIEAA